MPTSTQNYTIIAYSRRFIRNFVCYKANAAFRLHFARFVNYFLFFRSLSSPLFIVRTQSAFSSTTSMLNMDTLSVLRQPVATEMAEYQALFQAALSTDDVYLGQALAYVGRRSGKMMRPLLVLLMAKEFGRVGQKALYSAVSLELLHTASLVHDDVVDDSAERRGQRSVNAVYDNKVAVLVGDYLLSVCLLHSALTSDYRIVEIIARLGATLSKGEIDQLAHARGEVISEDFYFNIIQHKTASLFAACAELGALSVGATDEQVANARRIGEIIGICFQIRDDIFDYFPNSDIGKPTYNDMTEGKLTLPTIFAVTQTHNEQAMAWAKKVKNFTASRDEIEQLVTFTIQAGGIEYAQKRMLAFHAEAIELLDKNWHNDAVKMALKGYIDYVVNRNW